MTYDLQWSTFRIKAVDFVVFILEVRNFELFSGGSDDKFIFFLLVLNDLCIFENDDGLDSKLICINMNIELPL